MSIWENLRAATARARLEARYAVTLAQAVGPSAIAGNPLRYGDVLSAVRAHGMTGAATAAARAISPGRLAVIDDRGPMTFDELHERSTALAAALHASGVWSDNGIGILCRNHREFFEIFFAAGKLGARTVLLNTDFAALQLADVCEREGVDVLVYDQECEDRLVHVAPHVRRVVISDDGSTGHSGESQQELIAAADASRLPRPERTQRVVLLTSGTTGTPKGAPRAVGMTLAAPGGVISRIPLRAGRTVFIGAPLFHAWGLSMSMLSFGMGCTLVVSRRLDAVRMLDSIARHDVDALITLPIVLSRLVSASGAATARPSALNVIALSGSHLRPELSRAATEAFGPVLYNLYGSTEVAAVAIATPDDLRLAPGTVGRPPFGTDVRILDAEGSSLAPGRVGTIFVRSTMQFDGYTDGGSKQSIDGYMSTGDIGYFDESGLLHVEGRDDDMIVSGGENVFPLEVESYLATHAAVREVAVIGVADDEFGARLAAFVVREGEITADEVREFARTGLARFKVPRDVSFVDELPRNPAGKVVKRLLIVERGHGA